jgi:hypothetical protein
MGRNFSAYSILLICIISSCSPASTADVTTAFSENPPTVALSQTSSATGTRTPSQTPTKTKTVTETSAFTSMPTPTAALFPWMQATGPFIIGVTSQPDGYSSTWYDLNSSASRTISHPSSESGAEIGWEWYAFITGSIDESGSYPEGGVVLHLKNLLTGEVQDIANLIPPDYYARQERMVGGPCSDCMLKALQRLNASVHSLSVSYDERTLAFGAMIEGDSSDVYTFDVDTGKLRRVENGPQNATNIHFSRDGERILFEQIGFYTDDQTTWVLRDPAWVVKKDGTDLRMLPKPVEILQWFSDNEYLAIGYWMRPDGYGNAAVVNIETGKAHIGCAGYMGMDYEGSVAVDPRSRLMAVITDVKCDQARYERGETALYIGPVYGQLHRVENSSEYIEEGLFWIGARSSAIHPFRAITSYTSDGPGFVGIGPDGTIDPSYVDPEKYYLSPTFWYVTPEFKVYDATEKIRYELHDPNFQSFSNVGWDTNSQGIIFQTEDTIYYWKLKEQAPRRIASTQDNHDFIYLDCIYIIKSLPHLRIRPTRISKPAGGTSIWTRSQYRELFQPGANRYDVTIPAYSSWRWSFSLGTTDSELFEKILAPEDVEFRINGEWIDPNMFRMTDQTAEGRFSRAWVTMLSGWRSGNRAELEIRYTLRDAVRDGNVEYPAGEYRQIISLVVE